MAMHDASGSVGQGGSDTSTTASGSGTNNAPAPAPAAALPGNVPNQFPNTNPTPPADVSYVHRPVHIGTITGYKPYLISGFHTNGQSNKVTGRMMADHLLFLRRNNLTPSERYFNERMEDWLHDWSLAHNQSFYDKVYTDMHTDQKGRLWNMPNTKAIRDQLKDLP